MVEDWPKVVGFLIGVSVLGALVWLVRWWREQSAKALEHARVWKERLRETDDAFLAACGIEREDSYASLALGLRRLIVEQYVIDEPPVNATDRVDIHRLGAGLLGYGLDEMDLIFRLEKATSLKIPRGELEPFFAAVLRKPDLDVREVVMELVSAARNARLMNMLGNGEAVRKGRPLALPSPPRTGERE